jgi:hypothetical protein
MEEYAKVTNHSFLLTLLSATFAFGTGSSVADDGGRQEVLIRIRDDVVRPQGSISLDAGNASHRSFIDSICSLGPRAQHGEPAPNTGGGTLNPLAFLNPTTINSSGRVAFNSQVDGSERNQGVFVADSGNIVAIAIGCGGGGGSGDPGSGCGDPSPIGGTFSGFFSGTVFTPDINDSGDVLFLCDVDSGSSPRALFLYRASTQEIVKVAAVGDPSPIGGIFGAVGPGSLNNSGKIVFLASPDGTTNSNIFMWDNGSITKVAAIGDPAPGGGTFSLLGTESLDFIDGTNIPIGPVPDINDSEQVCFRAIVSGGITERGIVVRTGAIDEWYVRVPDPTPVGGTYFDMQAASINNAGEIAFFADYRPTPSTFNSGWFAGSPEGWRKVIVFFDSLDGGQCLGLAFSRNPMQTIDTAGNVFLWSNLDLNGQADRLVVGLTDGSLLVAARRNEPSPIGGTIGTIDAWPAVNGLRGTLNASTPGAPGNALSAHMLFNRCPPDSVVSVQDPGWIPTEFRLAQNYPNPFNSTTTIQYYSPRGVFVSLKIYNVLGHEITTLMSERREPGWHSIEWEARGYPSGVYFYRLITNGLSKTQKLILLR